MAEVFICRKGSLTQPSKTALRKAGVVVVEADDPEDCQLIRAGEPVPPSDLLYAAMEALSASYPNDINGTARAIRSRMTLTLAEVVKDMYRAQQPKETP